MGWLSGNEEPISEKNNGLKSQVEECLPISHKRTKSGTVKKLKPMQLNLDISKPK